MLHDALNRKTRKKIKQLSPLSFLFLTACGGGGSDSNQFNQSFSGFVVKGPLKIGPNNIFVLKHTVNPLNKLFLCLP